MRLLEKGGIPMVQTLPIIGSIHKIIQKGLIQSEKTWLKQYGHVVGWYNGFLLNVVIYDRTMVHEVLVKQFNKFNNRWVPDIFPEPLEKGVSFLRDKEWKRVRSLLPAVFCQSKIRKMISRVNKCAASITEQCVNFAENDSVFEAKTLFATFSLQVMCTCGFGVDLDGNKLKREEFYKNLQSLFHPRSNALLVLAITIPCADKLLKRFDVSPFPKKTVNFIVDETTNLINERRTNPEKRRDDFLQLLADLSSGENDNKQELSTEEVNAQAFSFMVGSYETTSACLQFISYELALNQRVQDKLKSEIRKVVGEDEPTYEQLQELKYTGYVINEALRKYPPLARISRQCKESTVVKGIHIPKGALVAIPIFLIHHDPEFYPDPEEFRPERYSPDSDCEIDPVMYLPFGGGPRMCVGVKFAMMEIKIILVHLMRNVRFVPCAETEPYPPQFQKISPILHTVKPIQLKVVLDRY
ncbi:cytochrome P450 3A8-like isoform X2 [Argopecten irradians]